MATDDYIRENLIERFCIKSYFNHNSLSIHATTAHSSLFSQLHTLPNNSTDSHLDTSAFCLRFHAFIFSPVSGSVTRYVLPSFSTTSLSKLPPKSIYFIIPPSSSCLHSSALKLSASVSVCCVFGLG